MTTHKGFALALFAAVTVATAGASLAGEPQRHVVGASEIQTRIDQQLSQADADRLAIQSLLRREDVRQIAGAAGLNLEQAGAAAGVLSGPALEDLAAQARAINADIAGGNNTVVISTTTIIIILLILILLS
jgi:hypothetical protein